MTSRCPRRKLDNPKGARKASKSSRAAVARGQIAWLFVCANSPGAHYKWHEEGHKRRVKTRATDERPSDEQRLTKDSTPWRCCRDRPRPAVSGHPTFGSRRGAWNVLFSG